MFLLAGLVLVGIWSGRKAMAVQKNPYLWGLIAAAIYIISYAAILFLTAKWFKSLFGETNRGDFATQVVSLGLIVICFSLATLVIDRFLHR